MYAIEIENLTKKYGEFIAVDNLTLNIEKGIIFGFLGPNGAGKTTTILSMLGLIIPDNGKIQIMGHDVLKSPIKAKNLLGYLPENATLYEELTAWRNLEFFASFYRIPNREKEKRIEELLKLVGLWEVRYKRVKNFSKGMKQRLLLAKALVNDPDVLILDEPTSGLDPEGAHLVKSIVKEEAKTGKTVFFSSHILSEVEELSDKVGIIVRGRLRAIGPLNHIKKQFMELEGYEIKIETKQRMPELNVDGIIRVERIDERKSIIFTKEDIRAQISDYLTNKGITIVSLKIEEPSLEDVFLKTVYKREGRG
ncbi:MULTISPECIES: ABC transporter ATP-binding protein [Thermococcus]|uniref:Putative ABC transporter n=2 Tax=Thermococcus sibiricus TaxID=172049 RepID=C6A4Q5_THESM|nr:MULTISPECIES: ABC transporter ATP-binding protein [Thermococcus]KUK28177.1 MAG: Putative ABC transporter [Thermococcus sp. 40_45]HII67691.1 ABC transporter ATP-binding protein [Thermococcaceae archaeon]ACS90600.1 Putative ABC transporter [Thermococcus sibiricus MM 739]KUK17217.1 MAG: Putative ABC transporter [Thermococcus sibiricus]MBC7094565.1 ABC transporter ATP-binding protein [Thermococcus sp.]